MLPRPCLSFTLPSIHDKIKLDCRVYHPPCLLEQQQHQQPPSSLLLTTATATAGGNTGGSGNSGVQWAGHAAVVAHPYAPLGGCYDDPIVDVVAGTLLQLGFLVATFNFRGAASSEGRTSWTSKPEQADYASVVGFLAYYVLHLDKPSGFSPSPSSSSSGNRTTTTTTDDHQQQQQHGPLSPPPILLMAGYSYGALVTTRLPPLDAILADFENPPVHTAHADIRLRAQHLAEAWNAEQAAIITTATTAATVAAAATDPASPPPSPLPSPSSPRRLQGVRIGGDEGGAFFRGRSGSGNSNGGGSGFGNGNGNGNGSGNGTSPRSRSRPPPPRIREFQREERIRESVRALLARAKLVHRTPKTSNHCYSTDGSGALVADVDAEETETETGMGMVRCLEGVEGGVRFRSAYLAVSPPVGFVARLATMGFANPFSGTSWFRRSVEVFSTQQQRQQHQHQHQHQLDAGSDESALSSPLAMNPTLVVYGDQDSFISRKKIREWTALLARPRGSRVRFVEVSGAGHFWIEGDTWFHLRDSVGVFATELLSL